MKATLIGVQDMNFPTKDGKQIDGVKIHYSFADENTYGYQVDKNFIDRKVYNEFGIEVKELVELVGTVINLDITPKNKICDIRV